MQRIEAPPVITVDGKDYPIDGFSATVKSLVAIHTEWRNDLQEARLAVAKVEAALRSLDAELTQAVNKELNPPAPPAPAPSPAPEAPAANDASAAGSVQ